MIEDHAIDASRNFITGSSSLYFAKVFLVVLFRISSFVTVAYLTVANLVQLEISVHCSVSARSQ